VNNNNNNNNKQICIAPKGRNFRGAGVKTHLFKAAMKTKGQCIKTKTETKIR